MNRGTGGVLEVARSVLSELDLEVVLARVLSSARELTGARYAALGLLDESGCGLARFITAGVDDLTRHAIGPLPTGRGVLGELIANPWPLRLADVGSHPHSYGFPAGHPRMKSFLGAPVMVRGKAFGNLYLADKEGADQFSQEDEDALVLLAEFAGVAIDHARRFTGSETRREELQRTVDALDATIQIARALGGQTDLEKILELVAKRGRALVSARALVIERQQGTDLVVVAGAGDLPDGLVGSRTGIRDTVASAALRTLRPQRLEDELNRMRYEQHGLGRLGFSASAGLVVPLVFRGQAYGVLLVVDRLEDGPAFSADDQRLLEAFAASAASAVATAQAVAVDRRSQRLAAAEEERRRWARELHDETLQGLAALRLGLAVAQQSAAPDAIARAAADAVSQLDEEIANLRALITDLRPAALDELGTEAAVESLVERTRRAGLDIDLRVDLAFERGRAPNRHTPELETAVYRIVQEALTNARKHGTARHATVEISEDDHCVRLSVRDDGGGFDLEARATGFGLLGMRERVELLDGTFAIDSAPGRGTAVTVSFPVQRRDSGHRLAIG